MIVVIGGLVGGLSPNAPSATLIATVATGPTRAIALPPYGTRNLLAAVGTDGDLRLWRSPEDPVTLDTGSTRMSSAAFDATGSLLVAGAADGTVRLWSVDDPGAPLRGTVLAGRGSAINTVAVVDGGTRITAGSADGTVYAWDTRKPATQRGEVLEKYPGQVTAIAAITDSGLLFTGNDRGQVWAGLQSGSDAEVWSGSAAGAGVTALAAGPGARSRAATLAVGDATGGVQLRSGRTLFQEPQTLVRGTGRGAVTALAFGPGGTPLYIGTATGSVQVVRVPAHGPAERLGPVRTGTAIAVRAFSPDGTRVAVESVAGTVRVFALG
ncbi:hypothetical protein [Actinoplanes sp. NPDC051851]|uniref:WD40 repeat domain-containing protein n=1 Tax=Actinoplanes sp. NPDC051851 TaxID=3154753 RepID=UPI00342280B2